MTERRGGTEGGLLALRGATGRRAGGASGRAGATGCALSGSSHTRERFGKGRRARAGPQAPSPTGCPGANDPSATHAQLRGKLARPAVGLSTWASALGARRRAPAALKACALALCFSL